MVEGDLVDLTVPTLLQALASEGSTAVLKMQRGGSQGVLYFSEGTLVHAYTGEHAGDDAVRDLLRWHDGRFRLQRDSERQPRTVTQAVADFLSDAQTQPRGPAAKPQTDGDPDRHLLDDLLALLARLDQDRVQLAEGRLEQGGVPALLLLAAIVNSLIAFVTGRCADLTVLPSRVLLRMAETQPYTQLLGEHEERISISTAASVLNGLDDISGDRRRLFHDLGYALLDVLVVYGDTVSTLFHGSRSREEWRANFDVFVERLWTAVQHVDV
jgi:Domain of unknown function (DUF4388)